jgi:hypothetical protein
MIEQDAQNVYKERPYMVVVEAKKSSELDGVNSKAQLLAQIRHLQIQQ